MGGGLNVVGLVGQDVLGVRQIIDKVNQGRLGKVYFAARGRDTKEWVMKREQLSPRYTTALGELPVVK